MLIENYIPRHIRIGVNLEVPHYDVLLDSSESLPILDGDRAVKTHLTSTSVSAYDFMAKFKKSDFAIDTLLEHGVQLDVINVDRSQLHSIDEIEAIANKLTSLEDYAAKVDQQRKEQASWFSSIPSDDKLEINQNSKIE